MEPKKLRPRKGPEAKIQDEIIKFLTLRKWLVMQTHGNIYSFGFPDLYATNYIHGPRWIEVKNPLKYEFTPCQLEFFPKLSSHGTRIWILTAATEEEYAKLFQPPNWHVYLLGKL